MTDSPTDHPGQHVRCDKCGRHPNEMVAGRFYVTAIRHDDWIVWCADCRRSTWVPMVPPVDVEEILRDVLTEHAEITDKLADL